MGTFHLVEPCAGSAALTMHLIGLRRQQIVPYQGSKWKLRRQLADLLASRGLTELAGVTLNDIGPWGMTWRALSRPSTLRTTIQYLEKLAEQDPRSVYDRLQGSPSPAGVAHYAAHHLFLQRLAVDGKAVGTRFKRGVGATWHSPGFNKTSAYGTPGTERFGPVRPMIPSLIRVLERLATLSWPATCTVYNTDAMHLGFNWLEDTSHRVVVYIDPDYVGSTGYPNGGLPRHHVLHLARRWYGGAATVMISEAEPIQSLVDEGWQAVCLRAAPTDSKPFQSKDPEWVTISPVVNR